MKKWRKYRCSAVMTLTVFLLVNACREDEGEPEVESIGKLTIDNTSIRIDPWHFDIVYNDLQIPSAGCESKYFQFRMSIHTGSGNYTNFQFAGPASAKGLVPGEYPISASCDGAVSFIYIGKMTLRDYKCYEWHETSWGEGVYIEKICSEILFREDFYFQRDNYFSELNGDGVLKIHSIDQNKNLIDFELIVDADFAKDSIPSQTNIRKKVTAKYKGKYLEDSSRLITIPGMVKEPLPVNPCINSANPFEGNPIKHTLELSVNPNGSVQFKGTIELKPGAKDCYQNKITFKSAAVNAFPYDGDNRPQTDFIFIDQPTEVDFSSLPENKYVVTGELNSLTPGKDYIIVFKSVFYGWLFDIENYQYDPYIITYFRIKASQYTCINNITENNLKDCRF